MTEKARGALKIDRILNTVADALDYFIEEKFGEISLKAFAESANVPAPTLYAWRSGARNVNYHSTTLKKVSQKLFPRDSETQVEFRKFLSGFSETAKSKVEDNLLQSLYDSSVTFNVGIRDLSPLCMNTLGGKKGEGFLDGLFNYYVDQADVRAPAKANDIIGMPINKSEANSFSSKNAVLTVGTFITPRINTKFKVFESSCFAPVAFVTTRKSFKEFIERNPKRYGGIDPKTCLELSLLNNKNFLKKHGLPSVFSDDKESIGPIICHQAALGSFYMEKVIGVDPKEIDHRTNGHAGRSKYFTSILDELEQAANENPEQLPLFVTDEISACLLVEHEKRHRPFAQPTSNPEDKDGPMLIFDVTTLDNILPTSSPVPDLQLEKLDTAGPILNYEPLWYNFGAIADRRQPEFCEMLEDLLYFTMVSNSQIYENQLVRLFLTLQSELSPETVHEQRIHQWLGLGDFCRHENWSIIGENAGTRISRVKR